MQGVPCGIRIGLLCYHKKQKQQLLKTTFVTITTKFVSVSWVCQCLGYSIKSNYFPRFSLLEKKKNSIELKTIQAPNRKFVLILQQSLPSSIIHRE